MQDHPALNILCHDEHEWKAHWSRDWDRIRLLVSITTDFMVLISSAKEWKRGCIKSCSWLRLIWGLGNLDKPFHLSKDLQSVSFWISEQVFSFSLKWLVVCSRLSACGPVRSSCHRSWSCVKPGEISVVNTKQYHKNGNAWGENRLQVLWSWTAFKLTHMTGRRGRNGLCPGFSQDIYVQGCGAYLHAP